MKCVGAQVKRLPSDSLSGILIWEIGMRERRDKSDAGRKYKWEQRFGSKTGKVTKV